MTEILAEPLSIAGSPSQRLEDLTFTVKDVVKVRGMRLTAGLGATLVEAGPGENPFVSQMLAEGASCLGIAASAELAFDLTGELGTPATKNPLGAQLQPGGSSSGSAAAVALGFGDFSVVTDTGGSARVPAACCGVIGFKPTRDRLSTTATVSLSETCDHLALITGTFGVLGRVLGLDPPSDTPGQRLALGLPRGYLQRHLSAAAAEWFDSFCGTLDAAGLELQDVDLDYLDSAVAIYGRIVPFEAYRRHGALIESDDLSISDAMRARLGAAARIGADEYGSARRRLQRLKERTTDVGQACSMIVLPTLPGLPPVRGQRTETIGSDQVPLRDAMLALTALANLVGAPAVAFPVKTDRHGSQSVQIVGLQNNDREVIAAARHISRLPKPRGYVT